MTEHSSTAPRQYIHPKTQTVCTFAIITTSDCKFCVEMEATVIINFCFVDGLSTVSVDFYTVLYLESGGQVN